MLYLVPDDLSQRSQSSRSDIKGTITRNVFPPPSIAASIGTIDFPLPVGKATSKSFFSCRARITASRCSFDV